MLFLLILSILALESAHSIRFLYRHFEMMINLINVAYCAMKLLPYQDESFSDFRDKSVQDFRFALSEGIRQQVFFATLVQNIETQIKSSSIINALKQAIVKQEHYL